MRVVTHIFFGIGILVMVLSGGCMLLFMSDMDGQYVNLTMIAVIGGIPFLAGLATFLIARGVMRKRPPDDIKDQGGIEGQ